ncbi:MAG TPA: DNA mismatch repair endonuclease MutL [Desulfobacterales bacterium]
MSKIRILPEIISNKIAAGEVVERPASVVKELVENALDAGSRRIVVEVEKGGKRLIRVSDDGSGMNRDDALLALERYATSKIATDDDLFRIRTLGFRGEALPSIAAVSRFHLVTRETEGDTGTEIRVDGGKILQVAETGASPGTMITVENLFYNTPARRKFLKSTATEMGHIADGVAAAALGQPGVTFRLVHNSRELKLWPAVEDPGRRVVDVLGRDLQDQLFPVTAETEHAGLQGWIAAPHLYRSNARGIFLFVNGRYVRDRVIQHALFAGYAQRMVKGRFPMAVLFLKVPFDRVDVNVHPTKHEVRFADGREIHSLVRAAVADTLQRQDRPDWGRGDLPKFSVDPRPASIRERSAMFPAAQSPASVFKENRLDFTKAKPRPAEAGISDPAPWSYEPGIGQGDMEKASRSKPIPQSRFGDLRIVGQVQNTYIVCETENGLILLDQHAAHERVIYEQLQKRAAQLKSQSQRLLVPETVELSYREAAIFEGLLESLRRIGLEVEPFGGTTFVVKAVPPLLADRPTEPLIRELVDTLADTGVGQGGPEAAYDECLKRIACHGALRAHQSLSEAQIKALLAQLDACENPSHCPHGRPTWLQWTLRDLEKSFSRIV